MNGTATRRILTADEQRGIAEALRLLLRCESITVVPVTLAGPRVIAAYAACWDAADSSAISTTGMRFHLVLQL